MFDNLRDDSSFYEDEQNDTYQEPKAQAEPVTAAAPRKVSRRKARFMGTTALQRFLLSFMLLITVCVMGVLALMLTGRIGF